MSIDYRPESDTTYPNITTKAGDTITYEKFVTRTVAPMADHQSNLAHMALGVCGEAGELADAIKKAFAYKKPLDIDNVIEEMGDIEWYLAGMRQMLGIERDKVIQYNVRKLNNRYPEEVFTQAAAIARADKEPVAEVAAQVIDVTSEDYKQQKQGYKELFIFPQDDTTTLWPAWLLKDMRNWEIGTVMDNANDHVVLNLDDSISYLSKARFENLYPKTE